MKTDAAAKTCHSEEARRADEESVLLRGRLLFRSCSLSQILRFAQDDTLSSIRKSTTFVILRRATPDEESVLSEICESCHCEARSAVAISGLQQPMAPH